MENFVLYGILYAISFVLTYKIILIAKKKALLAEVTYRSSHKVPTPYGGGIAIAVSWFLGITYLYLSGQMEKTFYFALMPGIILVVVGFLDDRYSLSAKLRMLIQALTAFLGIYMLRGVDVTLLFEGSLFTSLFESFMAMVFVVWSINLYNFIDGINGYAGVEAIFIGVVGYLLFKNPLFIVLTVSVLGFLFWNFGNAKIFMGDAGSTLLGYNIAIIAFYYAQENPSNLWIFLTLFSLFWFDATITLLRRVLAREPIFQAHRKHAYQRLVQAGYSHTQVVLIGMIINVVLATLVFMIEDKRYALLFAVVILSFYMIYAEKRYTDAHR